MAKGKDEEGSKVKERKRKGAGEGKGMKREERCGGQKKGKADYGGRRRLRFGGRPAIGDGGESAPTLSPPLAYRVMR